MFNHDRATTPRAPLRYRVRSWCSVCECPIIPPAANMGRTVCPDCRAEVPGR